MCGRFTLTTAGYFRLSELLATPVNPDDAQRYKPRYNIAPSDPHWIVVERENRRTLERAQWGLVPSWAKEPQGIINARADSLHHKPSFKAAFRDRRCAVPADGFYEWTQGVEGKRAVRFHLPDDRLFLFAGLYEDWTNPSNGETRRTFTIVTTEADDTIRPIHRRMPVILSGDEVRAWTAGSDLKKLQAMALKPTRLPLSYETVSKRVNDPHNDDPECLATWSPEGAEPPLLV